MKKNYSNPSGTSYDDDFPELSESPAGIILPDIEGVSTPDMLKQQTAPSVNANVDLANKLIYIIVGGLLSIGYSLRKNINENEFPTVTRVYPEAMDEGDEGHLFKYALIGLVLKTPKLIERSVRRLNRTAESTFSFASHLMQPFTSNRMLKPVNRRYEDLIHRGERIVNDLVDTGRQGEIISQNYAQSTFYNVVEETVNFIVNKPEIRDLVQQQSISMAQEVSDEFQDRASSIDSIIERIVFKMIPGEKKDTTPVVNLPVEEAYIDQINKILSRKKP